jgi:hypothetical protein
MERTPARSASVRRLVVGGMLAALLIATGPAVGMALAQEVDDEDIGLGSLSMEGYVCYSDGICFLSEDPIIIWEPDE